MTMSRSASALLLCLGIAAIAAMIGIAFLRASSRWAMSGSNEMMIVLARDAALSGVAHATEQILGDYNASSLSVARHDGTFVVSPAPTFLDGPYRAPFVSSVDPNRLWLTQIKLPVGTNDVPEENHLLLPFVRKKHDLDHAGWHYRVGAMTYEGRGRYIEVGYHNTARPDPSVAHPLPVVPVVATPFTDLNAEPLPPAQGGRSNGLFLDASLVRLTSGTAKEQRNKARYRLRYAVGVEDLQGHLLSNPQADLDWDWRNPDNGYRKPKPWLDAAAYAWQNMVASAFDVYPLGAMNLSAPQTTALRMGHVFRGRGSASNADRRWTRVDPVSPPRPSPHRAPAHSPSSYYGYPVTFPMMFRAADDPVYAASQVAPNPSPAPYGLYGRQFWGNFTFVGDRAYPIFRIPEPQTGGPKPLPGQQWVREDLDRTFHLGGRLYQHDAWADDPPNAPRWATILPNPAGGELLTPIRLRVEPRRNYGDPIIPTKDVPPSRFPTYSHAYMGPQLSWYNQYFAVQGFLPLGVDPLIPDSDGDDGDNTNSQTANKVGKHWLSARSRFLTVPSPFGRGIEAPDYYALRAPTASDDATKHHYVGQLWKNSVNNVVYRADGVAPNGAVWTAIPFPTKWYHGNVRTPWLVNLLTAPPQTISQMILAYMYPEAKTYESVKLDFYVKTGGTTTATETYASTPIATTVAPDPNAGTPLQWMGKAKSFDPHGLPGFMGLPRSIDILNDQLGSGFVDFPAPSSLHPSSPTNVRVKPDYYQADPYTQVDPTYTSTTTIGVGERYPGPLCRGNSAAAGVGPDDFGRLVETSQSNQDLSSSIPYRSNGLSWCTHTGTPFLLFNRLAGQPSRLGISESDPETTSEFYQVWNPANADAESLAAYGPFMKRKVVKTLKSPQIRSERYIWDLACGLAQAIAFARATWVQYPTTYSQSENSPPVRIPFFDPRLTFTLPPSPPGPLPPGFDRAVGFNPASLRDFRLADSIEDIDRLFLRQLSENFDNPGDTCVEFPILQTPWSDSHSGTIMTKTVKFYLSDKKIRNIRDLIHRGPPLLPLDPTTGATKVSKDDNGAIRVYEDFNGNGVLDSEDLNHNGVLDPGEDVNFNGVLDIEDLNSNGVNDVKISSSARGKVMERMLNDFRLSFLGASPQYSESFRPLDFDGDGKVHCSCYPINPEALLPIEKEELTYKTARWMPVDSTHPKPGRGPALAPLPVPSPAVSDLDPNFGTNPWFCATGTFFIGKSHYYRIICRGEVYDNLLSKPVAAQTLETVLAVDPEGPLVPGPAHIATDNQVLFQRWHYNDSVSELPRHLR